MKDIIVEQQWEEEIRKREKKLEDCGECSEKEKNKLRKELAISMYMSIRA